MNSQRDLRRYERYGGTPTYSSPLVSDVKAVGFVLLARYWMMIDEDSTRMRLLCGGRGAVGGFELAEVVKVHPLREAACLLVEADLAATFQIVPLTTI